MVVFVGPRQELMLGLDSGESGKGLFLGTWQWCGNLPQLSGISCSLWSDFRDRATPLGVGVEGRISLILCPLAKSFSHLAHVTKTWGSWGKS